MNRMFSLSLFKPCIRLNGDFIIVLTGFLKVLTGAHRQNAREHSCPSETPWSDPVLTDHFASGAATVDELRRCCGWGENRQRMVVQHPRGPVGHQGAVPGSFSFRQAGGRDAGQTGELGIPWILLYHQSSANNYHRRSSFQSPTGVSFPTKQSGDIRQYGSADCQDAAVLASIGR